MNNYGSKETKKKKFRDFNQRLHSEGGDFNYWATQIPMLTYYDVFIPEWSKPESKVKTPFQYQTPKFSPLKYKEVI